MKFVATSLLLLGTMVLGDLALAQGLASSLGVAVYPADGQAPDKQAQDEGECYTWSRQTTGVDPANPLAGVQTPPPAQAPPPGAGGAGGALRGAAGGALIGNLADEDAGDFAAAGAVIGGIRGAKRAKQQQAQAAAYNESQTQAVAAQRMGVFKNAFEACMQGRKYSVK